MTRFLVRCIRAPKGFLPQRFQIKTCGSNWALIKPTTFLCSKEGPIPKGNIVSILDVVNPPGGQALETPGTYSYQTGTNKLTHIEGTPSIDYGYDSNGNITTESTWTYVYDLSNQLIRVLQGGNQLGEYTFNGAGQRIKKVTQTETRIFHYDLRGHIIAETNQTGQMLAEYVYLGDKLLTMIKPGESAYYFHNDHLGTPQVLTDATQAVAWKAAYTPFGEAVTSVATVENPFRFPGQYYDAETGLHYNYYRYYNPPIGRYLTPDPIGLKGGINLFAYTGNNPIKYTDSLGLSECEEECSKTLKSCLWLGAAGGFATRYICMGSCLALTKNKVLCNVVCSSLGGTVAGGLDVICYRAHKKCMDDCAKKEKAKKEKECEDKKRQN